MPKANDTSEVSRWRKWKALPHLGGEFFPTDGGIETTLIFLEGQNLPDFGAFHLLKTKDGEAALRKYFRTYAALASTVPDCGGAGLQGIVAKHGGAAYRRGRASGWVKVKTTTGRAIDAERAKWNE